MGSAETRVYKIRNAAGEYWGGGEYGVWATRGKAYNTQGGAKSLLTRVKKAAARTIPRLEARGVKPDVIARYQAEADVLAAATVVAFDLVEVK